MPLSMSDYNTLIKAGFSYSEITKLSEAKTVDGKPQPAIDLNSPAWRVTLNTRKLWHNDMQARGWTKEQIKAEIENYYNRDVKRSPFDFLKAEYRPPVKLDYITAIRNRAKVTVNKLYNKRYTSKTRRSE